MGKSEARQQIERDLEHVKVEHLKQLIRHDNARENYALAQTNKKILTNSQYATRHHKVDRDL